MALLKPIRNYVYNNNLNRFKPANFYSRPALPPWYQGMNGFGQARGYANTQFEYTLQQMAASPFSVNSKAYMERIRNETGLSDTGLYDTFGTIGGIVGAGMGAAIGAGFIRLPKHGVKGAFTNILQPKRTSIHDTTFASVRNIQEYNSRVDVFNIRNAYVDKLEDSLKNIPDEVKGYARTNNELLDTKKSLTAQLSELEKKHTKVRYTSDPTKLELETKIKDINNALTDNSVELAEITKKLGANIDVADDIRTLDKAKDVLGNATKALNTSADAARASGVAVDATKVGTKIATKAGGLVPWAGLALDTASLGISVAGLVQSIDQGDLFNTAFNTLATVADTASVVGDVLEFTPIAPVGAAISMTAGIVSIGISALQGWLMGTTIGRSFSPEGAYAQKMYAENLYSSMVQRPITTLGTAATKYIIPAAFNRLAGMKNDNPLTKLGLRFIGKTLTDNAIGNQVRAGISMMAFQGMASITSKIDDTLPWAPDSPEDMNFVSAISLYGDINDNVYGATRNKSILVGLVSGDSSAMTKALARSWGQSDEIYKSVAFDDVREAAGIDVLPIGNSLISILGEILIDPQNYAEVAQKISTDRLTKSVVKGLNQSFNIATSRTKMADGKGTKGTIEELVDNNGLLYGMTAEQRNLAIERLYTTYIERGTDALRKELIPYAMQRGRGSRGVDSEGKRLDTITRDASEQFEVLIKTFDDISNGRFTYTLSSPKEQAELAHAVYLYKSIKEKMLDDIPLSEEELKIKDKLLSTFAHMEKLYGTEETPTLVKNFIEDLDLNVSTKHIQKLYENFSFIKDNMDITDFFSRGIINISNPGTYAMRKAVYGFRKLFTRGRYTASSISKKAKEIIRFKEAKANLPKLVNTDEIKKAQDDIRAQAVTIDNILNKSYTQNKDMIDIMSPDIENGLAQGVAVYTESKNMINEAKKVLADYNKNMQEKQKLVYVPTNTTFSDGETVYVNDAQLPKLKEDIAKYEQDVDSKPLSRIEVDAKYARDIHSRDPDVQKAARVYKRKYDAVTEYEYVNIYHEVLDELMTHLNTSIAIMDTLSITENEAYVRVLSIFNLLRTFVNSRKQISKAERIDIDLVRVGKLVTKHTDNVKHLTDTIATLTALQTTEVGEKLLEINKDLSESERALKSSTKLLDKYTKELAALEKSALNVKENSYIFTDTYDMYNWDALKNNEDLDMYELELSRQGINFAIFDKDNTRIDVSNLRNIVKLIETKPDLSLQLEYKQSVKQIVQGIIFEYLPVPDIEKLLHSVTNYTLNFTVQEWRRMSIQKRFETIEEFLEQLNDSPFSKDLLSHLNKDIVVKIFNGVNNALLDGKTMTVHKQLADVSDAHIRRMVMSEFYKADNKNTTVRHIVATSLKQLEAASDAYNTLLNNTELKDNKDFLNILNNIIRRTNFSLISSTAYKFFQDYFYPKFTETKDPVNIFISPFAKELFPEALSKKQRDTIKKSKADYTEEQYINKAASKVAMKFSFSKVDDQWEYIKHQGTDKADQTTEQAISEVVNERHTRRTTERDRVRTIKNKVSNALKNVSMADIITLEMIDNFKVNTSLNNKILFALPALKATGIKNKVKLKQYLLESILKEELTFFNLDKIVFEFVTSKALSPETNKLKDYYAILKEFKRTSPGHTEQLQLLAKRLIQLELDGKITIVKTDLEKLRAYDYESELDILARRIVETYKTKKSIKIESKVSKIGNVKTTKLFKNAIYKAAVAYMYDNKGKSTLFEDKDDYFIDDVEVFLTTLKENTNLDVDIEAISATIIDKAIPIFNSLIAKGVYTDSQLDLRDLSDKLLEYEQRDLKGMTERTHVMTSDVATKLILGSTEMKFLVEDILTHGDLETPDADREYHTTLFEYVNLLNKYITTNRKNKLTFNKNSITDVKYDATKEMVYFTMNNKDISLFDLLFVYNFDINTIQSLITHVSRIGAKSASALQNINDISIHTTKLYEELTNKWGNILSTNNFNMSKELFIETYGDNGDYEFLTDYNNTSVFNRLTLDNYLTTDVKDFVPSEDPEEEVYVRNKGKHKNMPTYLNNAVMQLYTEAKKVLASDKEIIYKGKVVQTRSVTELFLLYVLNTKTLDNKTKRAIMKNIFFYDLKVGHAKASDTHIRELKALLKNYTDKLKNSTDENGKRILTDKIAGIELSLKGWEEQHENVVHHDLDTYTKRFKYVTAQDGDTILSIFRNVTRTSGDQYVLAKDADTGLYHLVKHFDSVGNSNVNDKNVKGVPNYNYTIGENVIKLSDPKSAIFTEALKAIANNKYWQDTMGIIGDRYTVEAVTKDSMIIVLPNPAAYENAQSKLTKELRNATGIKHIYMLKQNQYDDIKAMTEPDGTYIVRYDYLVMKDTKGNIIGEVPNIINVKGSKVKANAYVHDLEVIKEASMHQKITINEIVSNIQKYAELRDAKVVVHKSYVTGVDFNKTEEFQKIYEQAKVTKVFMEFMELIDPSKTFIDINLDRVATLFFRNELIRVQEDGSLFDLTDENLLNLVENTLYRSQLKSIKVNDKPLITAIREALQVLQDNYKDTDTYYNYKYVLTPEFRDTVNALRQRVYTAVKTMSKSANSIANYVLPSLIKKQKLGLITSTTGEETRDRRNLTKSYNAAMYTSEGKYNNALVNPYSNVSKRNAVINNLIQYFDLKDPDNYNYTNEALMKAALSRLKTNYSIRTKEINEARKNKAREKLNLSLFWHAYKAKIAENKRTFENMQVNNQVRKDNPFEFDILDMKKFEALRPYINKAYTNIKPLIDSYNNARNNNNEAEAIDYNGQLWTIGEYSYRIESADDLFKFVVYDLFQTYLNNISEEVLVKTDEEVLAQATLTSQDLEPEARDLKVQKLMEDNWNKKVTLKLKPEYRLYTYNNGETTPLEWYKIDEYFTNRIPDMNEDDYKKVHNNMLDIFNYFEELLFSPTPFNLRFKEEQVILKNNYKTVDEYLRTIPKEHQDEMKFLIEFAVFKKDVDPKDYGIKFTDSKYALRVPDNSIKIVSDILRRSRAVTFDNSAEVFKLSTTPELDYDIEFKNYVVDKYLKMNDDINIGRAKTFLRQFGITQETQINLFKNKETMADIVYSLSHALSKQQMFALVSVLNMVKEQYIRKVIFKKQTWSWRFAHNELTTNVLHKSIDMMKGVDATGVFKGNNVFGNNILTNINESVDFIFRHLAYVEDTNKVLNAIIIPRKDTPNEVTDMHDPYITTTQNNMMTEAIQTQRDLYKYIFKDARTMSAKGEAIIQFDRAFGNPVLDLIEESNATSIGSVASQNDVYNSLRELYTNVMLIIRKNHGPKQFIRMLDITTAFKSLTENPKWIALYANAYDVFVKGNTNYVTDDSDNAIKKVIDYFNDNGSLVNVDDFFIKATLGYILKDRFELKDLSAEDMTKQYLEYSKAQLEATQYVALEKYKAIAYRLNLAEDTQEIVRILYNKDISELSPDQITEIESIRILKDAVKAGISIDYRRLHDTFITQLRARKDYTQENVIEHESIIGNLKKRATVITGDLESYDKSQRAYKRYNGTVENASKVLIVEQEALANKQKELDGLLELKESIAEQTNKVKVLAKKTILYNNISLLENYIEQRNNAYAEKYMTLHADRAKMEKSVPDIVLNEYYRRKDILKKHTDYFATEEFALFKLIRSKHTTLDMSFDALFKTYAEQLKLQGITDASNWYQSVEEAVDEIDKENIALKATPALQDSTGKYYSYAKHIRKFKKNLVDIEKRAEFLEKEYNEYLPQSIDDIDDDFKVTLVNGYLAQIVKKVKATQRDAYKTVFDNRDATGLDVVHLKDLKAKIAKKSTEYVESFKKSYLKYLKYIDDTVETPEDAIKLLEPLIYTYKTKLKANGTVKLNFKTTVAELGESEELKTKLTNVYTDLCLQVYLEDNKVDILDLEQSTIEELKQGFSKKIVNKKSSVEMLHTIKQFFIECTTANKAVTYNTKDSQMGMLINNISTEVYNNKISKRITYYEIFYKRIANISGKLENNNAIISAIDIQLKSPNVKTTREIITQSVQHVFKDEGLTLDNTKYSVDITGPKDITNMMNFIEYLLDDNYKSVNSTTVELEASIKTVKDELKVIQDSVKKYTTYTITNVDTIKALTDELKELQIEYDKRMKDRDEEVIILKNKFNQDFDNTDSNIDSYKNLYRDDIKDASGNVKTNTEIINDIITKSEALYDGNLRAVIKTAAVATVDGSELHNPIVDSLITLHVYLKQLEILGKPVPDTFTVFDMETYLDDHKNHVPYQIAFVKQYTDANGVKKLQIHNGYFNSQVFFDYIKELDKKGKPTGKEVPGPLLKKFYKQQQDIMIKDDKELTRKNKLHALTQEEYDAMDKRTTALINKVKGHPNNVAFIEIFIRELATRSDAPIVAHNGEAFDLPNFNLFISNYAKRLLPNLYYQIINDNNPKAVKERFENSVTNTLTSDEFNAGLREKYNEGIGKILTKVNSTEILNESEIKLWDEFIDAIFKSSASQVIKNVETQYGFVINEDLKTELIEDKEEIESKVLKYLSSDNATRDIIKGEIVDMLERGYKVKDADEHVKIVKFVEELLIATEDDYKDMKQGNKLLNYGTYVNETSRYNTFMSKARAIANMEEVNSEGFSPKEVLDNYMNVITQIKSTVKTLKETNIDVNDTLINIQDEVNTLQDVITHNQEELIKATKDLDKYVSDKKELLDKITTAAKEVNTRMNNLMYRSNKYVNSYIDKLVADSSQLASRRYNTGLLRLEMDEHLKMMNANTNKLRAIIDTLSSKTDFTSIDDIKKQLEDTSLSEDLFLIKTDSARTQHLEVYNARKQELLQYIVDIKAKNVEGSQEFKDLLTAKLNAVKKYYGNYIAQEGGRILDLWNTESFMKLMGIKENLYIKDEDQFKPEFYNSLFEKLLAQPDNKEDEIYKALIRTLNDHSQFSTALSIFNKPDLEVFSSSLVNELLIKGIEADIKYLDNNISYLNNLDISKVSNEQLAYKSVQEVFGKYLTQLQIIKENDEYITRGDIFNIVLQRDMSSGNMSPKQFKAISNTLLTPEELKKLDDPNAKFGYVNPFRSDDKYVRMLRPELVYNAANVEYDAEGEEKTRITITVYDDENYNVQQFWFYAENPSDVTFNLNYTYTTSDKELSTRTRTNNFKNKTTKNKSTDELHQTKYFDAKEYINDFYYTSYNEESGKIVKGVTQDIILKNAKGEDASYESIKKLMLYYNKYRDAFTSTDEDTRQKALSNLLKNSVSDQGLPVSTLQYVNMTDRIQEKFHRYLDVYQTIKGSGNFLNTFHLYYGIINKLLGKYNAQVPGKILNMIPTEYSSMYTIVYDDETLRKNNVDLLQSSEGSAGDSSSLVTKLTVDIPFRQSTHAIRSVLSNSKIYARHTNIGIINDLYEMEYNAKLKGEVIDNIIDLIDTTDTRIKDLLIETYSEEEDDGKNVWYHESANIFTEFEITPNRIETASYDYETPLGIFLKPKSTKGDEGYFGDHLYAVKVKAKNTITFKNRQELINYVYKQDTELKQIGTQLAKQQSEYEKVLDDISIKEASGKYTPEKINEMFKKANEKFEAIQKPAVHEYRTRLQKFFVAKGYDSVELKEDIIGAVNSLIVFKPEDTKILGRGVPNKEVNYNKRINTFTPNVVTKDMNEKYKDNELHMTGVNLQVAFTNDPYAFEDTILVDKDDAKALGWTEGNKTWLGLYGFKGAVKFVKGLREMYGTTFVANASSVQNRGAYGAPLEMTLNTIRKYLNSSELMNSKNPTAKELEEFHIKYGISAEGLELLSKHKETLIQQFTLDNGKIIVDANIDYEQVLLDIFGISDIPITDIEIDDINTKGNWLKLLITKPTKEGYIYVKKQNEGIVPYLVSNNIIRGELYTTIDSENIAEHKANSSSIDKYGNISYVNKDLKGNVKNGPVISPSLVYTMLAKGDIEWDKAFPQDTKALEMHAELLNFGIQRVIERYQTYDTDGTLDVIKTVQKTKQELSGDTAKYVNEYLKNQLLYEAATDEKMRTWYELRMQEINEQVKQYALDNIEGSHGSYYQSNYRKHEGIRQQTVADINLAQGELRVSKEGWEALLDTNNNNWVQEEKLDKDQWEKLVQGFDEEHFINADGTVGTKAAHTLKNDHIMSFTDQDTLDEYVDYLNGIGITKDYYNIKDLNVRFIKKARKFGYVLAARSPVQDYNAVPILKIIGFNNHNATEANAYLYKMIGGDNDGDTIGMASVSAEQYKHLKNLDATQPEYYDANYISDINKKDLSYNGLPAINKIDLRYAYVGKKTFEGAREGAFKRYNWNEIYILTFGSTAKDYIDNLEISDTPDVFKGSEAKAMAYKRMYVNTIIRYISGGINELLGDEELNPDKHVFTLKDYKDISKVNEMYNIYQEEITKRYLFDVEIYNKTSTFDPLNKLTEKDLINLQSGFDAEYKNTIEEEAKNILASNTTEATAIKQKVLFNKIYNKVLQSTITRIQTSKRGINAFGGTRKGVLQASVLSAFSNINKDETGNVWNFYRINKDPNEALTPESIAESILEKDFLYRFMMNIDKYKDDKDFIENAMNNLNDDYRNSSARFNQTDLIDVLTFVYTNYSNMHQAVSEFKSLANALINYTPTKLIEHFISQPKQVKYHDTLVKALLQRIQYGATTGKEKLQELNKVDIEILKMQYFGRFKKEGREFFKLIDSKDITGLYEYVTNLSRQYIRQHVIDRKQFNNVSRMASLIISLSKHGGIDIDTTRYFKAYAKSIKMDSAKNSIRHIGIADTEHNLFVSMAMEQNRFEQDHITLYNNEIRDRYKDLFPDNPVQLSEDYNTPEDAKQNLKNLIRDTAKVELLGTPYVPDSVYNRIEREILNISKILNITHKNTITKRIDVRKAMEYVPKDEEHTFEESIRILLKYNIPSYRIKKFLDGAYTIYKSVNNLYFSKYGTTLSKSVNPYIKECLMLYELLHYFYIPQERADFENNFIDNQYVSDFFLNISDVDPSLLAVDEETGAVSKLKTADYNRNLLIVPKYEEQEAIGNLHTATYTPDAEIKLDEYERMAFKKVMTELDLLSAARPETLGDIINKTMSEFITYNNIYSSKRDALKTTQEAGVKSKRELEVDIINRYIYNMYNTSEFISEITESNNKYKIIENKIKELKYLINKYKLQTQTKEKVIKNIQGQSDYFKVLTDKNATLNKLEIMEAEYQKMYDDLNTQVSKYAFNNHFKNGILLLASADGKNINDIYLSRPKILEQKQVDQLKNHNLLNMDKYQTPFETILSLFATKKSDGSVVYDWDAMWKWYKENNRLYRLTVVMKAFDDETLLRKLHHMIRKTDDEIYNEKKYSQLSKFQKSLPWVYAKHKRATRFKTSEDLYKFMEELNGGKQKPITLEGKDYNYMSTSIKLDQQLSPTLKEIDVRSAKELREVGEYIIANKQYMIGFTNLNDTLSAMEQAYIPYQFTGKFAYTVAMMQQAQKLLLRLTPGFLLRNLFDTYNQLATELYQKRGMYGMFKDRKQIMHYFGLTMEIYQVYKGLSEERIMTLTQLDNMLMDIESTFAKYDKTDIKNITQADFDRISGNIGTIKGAIDTYITTAGELKRTNSATKRIEGRQERAEAIQSKLETTMQFIEKIPKGSLGNIARVRHLAQVQDATKFLLNINFAEYYLMFDKLMLSTNQAVKFRTKIQKYIEAHKEAGDLNDFKHILFDISAFMNTNAQIDVYKQETYKYLYDIRDLRKDELIGVEELNYDTVKELLNKVKEENVNAVYKATVGWSIGKTFGAYTYANEWIENVGRINGFLYDRFLNGYGFDEATGRSLRRFFNYGQRSPIEMQSIADTPYLSFPIRTIDNWLDRLLDPTYIKLMSDIIDGVYSQFADEDGQYNEFTQFQMMNGWVPMGRNFGTRIGNGALDVQNLLSNTSETMKQRSNPLLRGVQSLITTGDFTQAVKQLATIGALTKVANMVGPRQALQKTPVVKDYVSPKPRSIGTTVGFTYDMYNYKTGPGKYTPYKYRNNGRYKQYENIYRDWFTKYGRMRVPSVDPLSLIKTTQWRQYVRWRRSNNMK